MRFEVLHIDACPNSAEAIGRLREALVATGHPDAVVETRLLRTPEDAADAPFAGSPTITLDGTDLFPTTGQTNDLACRVYATPAGLAGVPTTAQIIDAITSRAH